MTRLFIQFYVGVLVVLFSVWLIHGAIAERQIGIEIPRIVEVAHRGGITLLAERIDAASLEERAIVLNELRQDFGFTQKAGLAIRIVSVETLSLESRQRFQAGEKAVFDNGQLVTMLASGNEALRLGPFPQFTHYERAMQGGLRLAMASVAEQGEKDHSSTLERLEETFGYDVVQLETGELPGWQRIRIAAGEDSVFYLDDGMPYVVAPLSDRSVVLRFGPLPDYADTEQRIFARSTAIVLLVTAIAIALLLRPMARQLRLVEQAARAISSGELNTRVDESMVRSAKPLAEAFNQMATRTETLLRTQREILQTVSHELRTPLSRIRFAIDLIEAAEDDAERSKRLQAVDDATSELDELVGELLQYVRLESAEPASDRETLPLEASCDALVEKYSAIYTGVRFATRPADVDSNSAVYLDVVPTAFHRAIGNLLSNAGRYAKNQVVVSSTVDDGSVTISVEDDGPGVPEDDRERVLEPFTRLEGNAGTQGVGLGLAIVRRIVIQHGGSVSVGASNLGGCGISTTWPMAEEGST
jgi:two-component system, OmpR family, sensor histidine kinase RstB